MALCDLCLGRLLPDGGCGRCDRKLRRNYENDLAERQYIARQAAKRPAVELDQRTCEVCLKPSSFSPCTRCEESEFGPLHRGEPW